MRKLLAIAVIGAALSAGAAQAQQGDPFDRSLTSKHWNVIGLYGEAPKRAAFLVDRDSVAVIGTPNVREFSFFVTVEGMAPGDGIMSRMRVVCDEMAVVNLGKVEYYNGTRKPSPPDSGERVMMTPQSAAYPALQAVCTGDWSATGTIDAPIEGLQAKVFTS
ncbi:hypothetical protein OF829_17060 [Sphingomonas sp. LB-2]|uniref:hypothetical protein n=1 Tax=Sphingomonas caeni TaxID=2984949 RepID=UPI00222F8BD0|nr:hypothetical protein [Sphingomonas caeni]MCW3848950.1 hypothetical protein [Sphingomonas caeni]